jgi:hypothetical protein
MDEFWVTDKSFPGTDKNPPTIVAKWIGEKPIRQPLPDTITSFIAVHVEKGIQINQHVIKCKEGESPEDQAVLVSHALAKPMEISCWKMEADGFVHVQCRRLAFTEIRFMMDVRTIDSQQQASATNKHREKLASVFPDNPYQTPPGARHQSRSPHDPTGNGQRATPGA